MLTYRIAICEDESAVREQLKKLCTQMISEWGLKCVLALFPSTDELDAAMRENPDSFDLLLLDIQMEGVSGMEYARALRQRGNRVSIIFITNCVDYALEGYSVQPVHFILKPVTRELLEDALRTDIELNHKPKTMLFRTGGKSVSLAVSDIRYIESMNHSIIVHLADTDRVFSLSLSETERNAPDGIFFRCHNSFLVNMEYVAEIGRTEIRLRDGCRLPVGRRFYQSFQSAFVRYMNR